MGSGAEAALVACEAMPVAGSDDDLHLAAKWMMDVDRKGHVETTSVEPRAQEHWCVHER